MKAPTYYSYNKYVDESTGHRGYINSAIPKISTNYVPKFTKYSAHKTHLQNRLIPYNISGSEDMNGCDTSYNN